ncbi:MAG: DUF922 domain-containing protein [Flavobacteriaceae bacterium]|nr:DUF922 domain-containing protein [Flavobacteriaceae bacterium]
MPPFKFLFLLLIVPFVLTGDEPISWKNDLQLTWDDFKGEAKLESGAVAVTASGITFSYSVKRTNDRIIAFDAIVNAHFYPENSWYLKDKTNDQILKHEQLHFDITELHVRMLRKKISELKVSQSIKEELHELHLEANNLLREMQNKYDLESDNSINRVNQLEWEAFIESELKRYEDFSSK